MTEKIEVPEHDCLNYLRSAGPGKKICVVCGAPDPTPTCPHGCGKLRWVDTEWYCPKCGDEWGDDR